MVFSGDVTYVALADSWIIINVGGGPTDDKPAVSLETPRDPDRVSSFLNIRVRDIEALYAECLRSRVSWSLGVAGEWAAGPVDQVDDHGMRGAVGADLARKPPASVRGVSCSCSSAESVSEGIRKW